MDTKVFPKSAANGGPTLYGATTPNYHPQPNRRRRHRSSRCRSCCLWTTFAILVVLLLACIAAVVFYILYQPHRPTFTVTSLKLSYLNATSSAITSKLNLTVTVFNPNKKLTYIFNPTSATIFADGVNVGRGSFHSFVHRTRNKTVLRSIVAGGPRPMDGGDSVKKLKAAIKSRKGVPLKVRLDTKVKVKVVGGGKTPRIGIRVTCDGLTVAEKSSAETVSTANAKCKVHTRIKIWRWTF